MKRIQRLSARLAVGLVLIGSVVVSACKDDQLRRSDLVGTFVATRLTVLANGTTEVTAAGGEVRITLANDGTTTGRLFVPEGIPGLTDKEPGDFEASLDGTWSLLPDGRRILFNQQADTFFRDLVVQASGGGDRVLMSAVGEFEGFKIDMVLMKI